MLTYQKIMVISFLQVLKESVQKIIEGVSEGDQEAAELPLIAVGAMAGTVILKGIIWFACIRVKTTQVQALAQGTMRLFNYAIFAVC